MKDKNKNELKKGQLVDVPKPNINKTDLHRNEFVGTVDGFRNGNVIVRDMDGDAFEIESERLEVVED